MPRGSGRFAWMISSACRLCPLADGRRQFDHAEDLRGGITLRADDDLGYLSRCFPEPQHLGI